MLTVVDPYLSNTRTPSEPQRLAKLQGVCCSMSESVADKSLKAPEQATPCDAVASIVSSRSCVQFSQQSSADVLHFWLVLHA